MFHRGLYVLARLSYRFSLEDIRTGLNTCSLLEDLGDNRKVCFKVATNGTSNISKALKNGWLELIGKCGTLFYLLASAVHV